MNLYSFSDPHSLYVSDLDGTLLDGDAQISILARDLLINIITQQHKAFTIASARSLTTIKEILKDLPLVLPIIQLNGALITDYHNQEDFHRIFLAEKEVLVLLDILNEFQACFLVSAKEDHTYQNRCLIPVKRNLAMEWFYQERMKRKDPRILVIPDNDYIKDYFPISLTLIEPHARSLEIFKVISMELKDRLEIYPMGVDRDGWEWTTFQDSKANKGGAVEKICEIFNFIPKQVTVFGDNVNDLSMFTKGFKGVAVENAHPLIKSKAHSIIGDHRNQSVLQYVTIQ